MNIKDFSNSEEFIQAAVSFISAICQENKKINLSLSGGSTPRPIYEALAEKKTLSWSEITLWQVDERYTSKNSPDSNFKLINDSLVTKTGASFHYFDTSLEIQECLEKYQSELKNIPEQKFDLCLLGIGPDGHTASLFPYCEALNEEKLLVAHSQTEEFAIKDRLTITWPMIMQSKKLLVLLKGTDKKITLDKLLNDEELNEREFPAKKLLKHPDLTIFSCFN